MQRSIGTILGRIGAAALRGKPLTTQHRAMAAAPMFDAEVMALYRLVNQNMVPMWDRVAATVGEESGGAGTVLDLASGPGNPSLQLAAKFPGLKVTCSDASPDMVEKAKAIAEEKGLSGALDFAVLDMQDLSSVETASFDNVTVCLGFMFPSDLKRAVEEVYRVTKPGGTMITTVWRSMRWTEEVKEIMAELLGKDPPEPRINPMALRENDLLDAPLKAAGFEIKTSEEVPIGFTLGNRDQAWQVFTITNRPLLVEMNESGDHGDVFARFKAIFEPKVETWWAKDQDGNEVLKQPEPGIYRLIVAKKPL